MKSLLLSCLLFPYFLNKQSDCEQKLMKGFECSNDCVVSYQCGAANSSCEQKFLEDNHRFMVSQKNKESCEKIEQTQGCQLLKYVQNCIQTLDVKDKYGKEFQKTIKCQKNCWAKIQL